MLLCTACDSRFHITCLSPPLGTVTAEDWFCQECATEDSHTNDSFSREESEIAEAEMMDLLSQFVPTSSRLRPSTSAQRAASVPPRRSARVQQHGSRTHLALPHTVQHVPRYLLKSSRTNSEDATTSSLILNTKKRGRKDTYKNTRRRTTDKSDPV
ncbi:PHD and RING finger domain-containing protein 1-like [Clarias gariepinus]|uniref:PHD and RING finger domain-containing protein 1-like n=1 Tax=Clarias gariepinus TaxID=13013 RepID=UPI00234CD193|nr:PHD and RING finger domain-containing protein 1-like [Clarias gariepinus]